jgi:hypothetical protein
MPRSPIVLQNRVKVVAPPCRFDGRIEVVVLMANGLARSIFPGGISMDGVRRVLPRTFNPHNTRSPSNEGDAR